jgi:hypothetical protein
MKWEGNHVQWNAKLYRTDNLLSKLHGTQKSVALCTIMSTACENRLQYALYHLFHTLTAGGSRACVTVRWGQWFLGLLPSAYIETRIRWTGCFVSCHSNGYFCRTWFLSFPDHVTKDIMMLAWCQHLSPGCFKRDKKYANACEAGSTSLHTCPTNFSSLYRFLVMKLSEDRWRYLSHTHTHLVKSSLNWVRNSRHIRLDRIL